MSKWVIIIHNKLLEAVIYNCVRHYLNDLKIWLLDFLERLRYCNYKLTEM